MTMKQEAENILEAPQVRNQPSINMMPVQAVSMQFGE